MPSVAPITIGADDHAFQHRMGIAFNLVAVHECAGIAFIRIADDVLCVALRFGQEIPLVAGKKTGAATPAQPRRLDLLDHGLGAAIDEHLIERLVAADARCTPQCRMG